jgi:L-lactate dehydrogenase
MELIVTIIGFGNVGKTVAALLLPYKNYEFQINIMDTDKNVSGALLDFEHGAQLYDHHQVLYNNTELFNQSDFIFHCAGASVPKGYSRIVTSQTSIDITETIFKNFTPQKEPFIIVIANPVEIISYITQKITRLPKQNIIGTGTLIDSIRMNHFVKQTHRNIYYANAILLGEHGSTAFLSKQLSDVNGQSFQKIFNDSTLNYHLKTVHGSAEKIKETQNATIYGVSYCAIQIFESLLSEKGVNLPISTFIPKQLSTLIGYSDIYLSLYSEINHTGAHPVDNYHPNQYEIDCLKKSCYLIRSSIPLQYI